MQTIFIKFLLMEPKIWISKLLIFLVIFYCSITFAQSINGKAKIIDGDTIHIGKNKIRLYGIDAPEINQTCTIKKIKWKCGIDSSQALENIISQNKVSDTEPFYVLQIIISWTIALFFFIQTDIPFNSGLESNT